jgi:hypothetical protein
MPAHQVCCVGALYNIRIQLTLICLFLFAGAARGSDAGGSGWVQGEGGSQGEGEHVRLSAERACAAVAKEALQAMLTSDSDWLF